MGGCKKQRPITQRQQQVLDYVIATIKEFHRPPTYRELADHLSLAGAGSVKPVLNALVKKGALIRDERGTARPFRLNPERYVVKVRRLKKGEK